MTGIASYRAILAGICEHVSALSFEVRNGSISDRVAYLRWIFTFTPKKGGAPWRIEGMSEVHLTSEGGGPTTWTIEIRGASHCRAA